VVVDGLRRLEIDLDTEEAEAYLHAWRVVGHILGIQPEVLPANMADAEALARMIQRRQYAACPEGHGMTAALIGMMQQYVPGNIFDSVPAALIRYLMGGLNADLLGVQRGPATEILMEPLRLVDLIVGKKLHTSAPIASLSQLFSRRLIEGTVWVGGGGKRIPFTIPTDLRQVWGVNWTA
jgi:hypothetical protein